jgi:capsular polysaccharide biosynthesis protein
MVNETNETSLTVDFKSLLKELTHRWVAVVAIFLICLLAAFIYGQFVSTPKYTSSASIYAVKQGEVTTITTSEINISTHITKDCCELIMSRSVLEDVISNLKLNTTYEGLKSKISVTNSEETRFINVKVTADDPETARRIADDICAVAKEKIIEIIGVDWVKIANKASMPTSPSSPSVATFLIYGFLGAILLSAGFIVLSAYSNDKIACSEDVEQYVGICVLATIPYNRNKAKSYYSKKR